MGSTESREASKEETAKKVAVGVVGAMVAAWGLSKVFSGDSSSTEDLQRKMMKAPGRNKYIIRDQFEDNPRDYFRSLRNK